jgi:hypothetical protein
LHLNSRNNANTPTFLQLKPPVSLKNEWIHFYSGE